MLLVLSFGSTTVSFTGTSGKLPVISVNDPGGGLELNLKICPLPSHPVAVPQEENPENVTKAIVLVVGLTAICVTVRPGVEALSILPNFAAAPWLAVVVTKISPTSVPT